MLYLIRLEKISVVSDEIRKICVVSDKVRENLCGLQCLLSAIQPLPFCILVGVCRPSGSQETHPPGSIFCSIIVSSLIQIKPLFANTLFYSIQILSIPQSFHLSESSYIPSILHSIHPCNTPRMNSTNNTPHNATDQAPDRGV